MISRASLSGTPTLTRTAVQNVFSASAGTMRVSDAMVMTARACGGLTECGRPRPRSARSKVEGRAAQNVGSVGSFWPTHFSKICPSLPLCMLMKTQVFTQCMRSGSFRRIPME